MKITFGLQVLIATVVLGALTLGGWAVANEITFHQAEQPILFPHDLHAGTRQIACQYCHRGVHQGTIAGVPSVQECADCHQAVSSVKDKPEIKKLMDEYWRGGKDSKPIDWFKVYKLPDHVKFSHQVHINRGIDCKECHGNVKEMRVLTMAHNPVMGFCLDCHLKPEYKGPTQCSSCHY